MNMTILEVALHQHMNGHPRILWACTFCLPWAEKLNCAKLEKSLAYVSGWSIIVLLILLQNVDIRLELERSRQVFEEKVIEQSRHLSWLIAVINSPEKLGDVAWVFDAVLRTIETASELNPYFEFMPEFYITVCVDGYMALKNFFKLSPRPFTSLPSKQSSTSQKSELLF